LKLWKKRYILVLYVRGWKEADDFENRNLHR
jgi:hypothetical protein